MPGRRECSAHWDPVPSFTSCLLLGCLLFLPPCCLPRSLPPCFLPSGPGRAHGARRGAPGGCRAFGAGTPAWCRSPPRPGLASRSWGTGGWGSRGTWPGSNGGTSVHEAVDSGVDLGRGVGQQEDEGDGGPRGGSAGGVKRPARR